MNPEPIVRLHLVRRHTRALHASPCSPLRPSHTAELVNVTLSRQRRTKQGVCAQCTRPAGQLQSCIGVLLACLGRCAILLHGLRTACRIQLLCNRRRCCRSRRMLLIRCLLWLLLIRPRLLLLLLLLLRALCSRRSGARPLLLLPVLLLAGSAVPGLGAPVGFCKRMRQAQQAGWVG